MRRRSLLASLPLCVIERSSAALAARGEAAVDLGGTVWAEAAAHAGLVDPWVVYSIALYESGVVDETGRMTVYPWTLAYGGRGVRLRTRAAAERCLADATSTTNVDVGLMGVNWAAHHWRVERAADLLEPELNVRVGAEILRVAMTSAPGDLVLGLGRYHSWTEWRARRYAASVWSLYLSLSGERLVRRRERLA